MKHLLVDTYFRNARYLVAYATIAVGGAVFIGGCGGDQYGELPAQVGFAAGSGQDGDGIPDSRDLDSDDENAESAPQQKAEQQKRAGPFGRDIEFEFSWTPEIPRALRNTYLAPINTALAVVSNLPPPKPGNHPFQWKDRAQVNDKKIHLFLTSHDNAQDLALLRTFGEINPEARGMTVAAASDDGITIYLFLFLDQLYFENNRERPDAVVRTIVTLAHEIYGNVNRFLPYTAEQLAKPITEEQRAQYEVSAFKAGIAFVERMLGSEILKSFPPAIRDKWIKDLNAALLEEKAALKTWEEALKESKRVN